MQPLPKFAPSFNPSVSEGGHDRVGAQACQGAEGNRRYSGGSTLSRIFKSVWDSDNGDAKQNV